MAPRVLEKQGAKAIKTAVLARRTGLAGKLLTILKQLISMFGFQAGACCAGLGDKSL
jgi:hypothetical protein